MVCDVFQVRQEQARIERMTYCSNPHNAVPAVVNQKYSFYNILFTKEGFGVHGGLSCMQN